MHLADLLALTVFYGSPPGDEVGIILWIIAILTIILLLSTASRWIAHRIWKGKARMLDVTKDLESLIKHSVPRLLAIQEVDSGTSPAPNKWSTKEILGHLVDSASNNHQRFIRAQLGGEIRLPDYDQEAWVHVQSYQTESWEHLVNLWHSYNLHLLHVIRMIPEDRLTSTCFVGNNPPVSLESLIGEYVRHLRHHLHQILP